MKKKNIQLQGLKVKSFITSMEGEQANTAKGGATIAYVLTNQLGCGGPVLVNPSHNCIQSYQRTGC